MNGKNGPYTPPMYSQIYRLTTVPESNDKGKWFGWEIERVGPVDRADIYQAAKNFAQQINAGEVKVKHELEDLGFKSDPF
jgi:hypothetical protein